MIRCLDCKDSPWLVLPARYFTPGYAMRWWPSRHGHIPTLWEFACECGVHEVSGGTRAVSEGWDDFALAQNDWNFWNEHRFHTLSGARNARPE